MIGNKARRTRDAVLNYMESGLVALPETEIRELSNSLTDFARVGVDRFEESIRKDLFLILKVFDQASRGHWVGDDHNRISSVSEAIQILGADQFKRVLLNCASLSNAKNPNQVRIMKEATNEAFVTGLMTHSIADELGLPFSNDIVLAGQVQQIGRVLACSVFPFEFQRRHSLAEKQGFVEAEKNLFGVSLLQLSKELLSNLSIPQQISSLIHQACVNETIPDALKEESESAVLAVARETSDLLSKPDLSWNSFELGLCRIIPKLSKGYTFSRSDFIRTLKNTSDLIEEFRLNREINDRKKNEKESQFPMAQRLNILADHKKSIFPPLDRSRIIPLEGIISPNGSIDNEVIIDPALDFELTNEPHLKPEKHTGESGLEAATRVFSIIKDFSKFNDQSLAEFLAWSHLKSLGLKNCIVLTPNEACDELQLFHAEGSWFVESMPSITVALERKTIFSPGIQTGKDLVLPMPAPEKLYNYIPNWLEKKVLEYHCAILPVASPGKIHAVLVCLGADIPFKDQDSVDLAQSVSLRHLVSQVWKDKNRPFIRM